MAGGRRRRVGESLPGCELARGLCRKHGPRDEEVAAAERPKGAFVYYQGASFGAPSPLKVEGRKLEAQLARRRGNASAWLFEIRIEKFSEGADTISLSSSRKRGPIHTASSDAEG